MNKKYLKQLTQFGETIKSLRLKHKMTQLELAKKSDIGLSTIQRIENAQIAIGLDIVFTLAEVFEVAPNKLFKGIVV